jgi:hypothetical protein
MRKHLLSKPELIVLALLTSILFACNYDEPDPQPGPALPPAKAVLLLPAQNEVCASGENQTAAASTVKFDWSDAANATSYVLSLKNLITNTVSDYTSSQSELKIAIPRATAFSWTVTSRSTKSAITALSDSWKFYNSGEGQVSYAPFPATLTFPAMGQLIDPANKVTLSWSGSDADNDLASYEVYFGKTDSPSFVASNKPDSQSFTVEVAAGTIYYWKIITKDAKGNTSDSGVFQFKIN